MSDKEKAEVFKMKADAARALAGSGTGSALLPIDARSDALVNAFMEDGSLPAAIEEHCKLSEQEPKRSERPLRSPITLAERSSRQATAKDVFL